jgi:hypothetical protein
MATSRWSFYRDQQAVADFPALVHTYQGKELASPFRSSVPLLALLRDAPDALSETFARLGVSPAQSLHLEYKVAPPQGEGLPSQTDLVVKGAEGTLAIEAKWTEPRYETVARRIAAANTRAKSKLSGVVAQDDIANRRLVVEGWLALMAPYCVRPLTLADIDSSVYQMIHRTASACAVGVAGRSSLAYLLFKTPSVEADHEFYANDLAALHRLMGSPRDLPFHLIEVALRPTEAFESIAKLKKGADSTAMRVKAALLASRLFDVKEITVSQIGRT